MSKRSVLLLMEDILEAADKIARFTQDLTLDGFKSDEKTSDAVVRNLEIIGEAVNRIPQEFRSAHSIIEWEKIIGLRHRIVHEYFGIDLLLIWQIVKNDLPKFHAAFKIIYHDIRVNRDTP